MAVANAAELGRSNEKQCFLFGAVVCLFLRRWIFDIEKFTAFRCSENRLQCTSLTFGRSSIHLHTLFVKRSLNEQRTIFSLFFFALWRIHSRFYFGLQEKFVTLCRIKVGWYTFKRKKKEIKRRKIKKLKTCVFSQSVRYSPPNAKIFRFTYHLL